jgi:hypothetical protein
MRRISNRVSPVLRLCDVTSGHTKQARLQDPVEDDVYDGYVAYRQQGLGQDIGALVEGIQTASSVGLPMLR